MELTAKDIREIELRKKYERQNLSENLADYHLLVDTLLYLHEAIVEQEMPIKYWQKESEPLFYKFAFHGLTLHQTLTGFKLSSTYHKDEIFNGKVFIDISSANAILRAQFEAFLMYHHIYVNPVDDDLKELRYNAWIYSSILQRQKFPSKTEYAKQQKAKDLILLGKMKEKISNLKAFQNLNANKQQGLLNKGTGKLFNNWDEILKETGFSESNSFHTFYTLLCISVHSEGLGIIQLSQQPQSDGNEIIQANFNLHNSKILICLMINSIMNLHEVVKKKYEALSDHIKYDIEIYSKMADRQKT